MKTQISVNAICNLTHKVMGAVHRKDPVRGGILFRFDENGIRATASNGEIQIDASEAIPQMESGAFVVDGQKWCAVLDNLAKGDSVSLDTDTDQGRLKVNCGRAKFTFNILDAGQFPNVDITSTEWKLAMEISAHDLAVTAKSVSHAMGVDDVRVYLNAMLWQFKQCRLYMVATDGHRMAAQFIKTANVQQGKFLIGRKVVGELVKLLPNINGKAKLSFNENQVFIEGENLSVLAPLVENKFPEYEKIIPKSEKSFAVDAETFVPSLKRALILSDEQLLGVKFTLDQHLEMLASNKEQEENREIVDIDWKHEPVSIGFNGRYVLEAMTHLGDENTKVFIDNPNSAMLIKSSKGIAVVMPMRL
jgi:DNA polymerase-3 subunit beta